MTEASTGTPGVRETSRPTTVATEVSVADDAEAVLKTFLAQKFDGDNPWNLKGTLLHRLVASFIWHRATRLTSTAGQGMTVAAATTRVGLEIPQVKAVVTNRLGANGHSGPLARAQDTATPAHLDLSDLAKQRVDDLGAVSPERSREIAELTRVYVKDRRRRVMVILWRAAALEPELWENASRALTALDQVALKDLLDRRLHAVERLHCNVGAHAGDETLVVNAAVPDRDSGWRDGMRVRLFEYPEAVLPPAELAKLPASQVGVGKRWVVVGTNDDGDSSVAYTPLHAPAVRHYNGSTTDTQELKPFIAWRFPTGLAPHWVVSEGKDSGYRIDFMPSGAPTAAQIIDSLFSHQGSAGGEPEKADFWNRAWLLCDLVISAIHIESLLFGLRRRTVANPGGTIAAADAAFNGVVALRPPVTVHRLNADGLALKATATVTTAFASLDAHLRKAGQTFEAYEPQAKILMHSDEAAGTTFADPYFRNRLGRADELQIGDQVKVLSSPVYSSLQRAGVWGLENALVMDVDPDSDNSSNRGGIKLKGLFLEGHGLKNASYPDFRTSLGTGLTDAIAGLRDVVTNNSIRPVFLAPVGDPKRRGQPLVEWAPFDDFRAINFDFNSPHTPPNIQRVQSGPWWVALSLSDFTDKPTDDPDLVTPDQALAKVPGAIGKPHLSQYGLNGDPTVGHDDARAKLKLTGDDNLFDHYILFPLVEPRVKARKEKDRRVTWDNLFFFHKLTGMSLQDITFRLLIADEQVIPGFATTSDPNDPLDKVPMIQPRPRREP
jgi:hypothetical protein